jgi:Flp pilus assembly protein TadB
MTPNKRSLIRRVRRALGRSRLEDTSASRDAIDRQQGRRMSLERLIDLVAVVMLLMVAIYLLGWVWDWLRHLLPFASSPHGPT